jgi:hypothetical protein
VLLRKFHEGQRPVFVVWKSWFLRKFQRRKMEKETLCSQLIKLIKRKKQNNLLIQTFDALNLAENLRSRILF